jgi:hypothetical protein
MTGAGNQIAEVEQALIERGWAVVDLADPSPVHDARAWLLGELRTCCPGLPQIEDYHTVALDQDHFAIVHDITEKFWKVGHGGHVVRANVALFWHLIGRDLHVQQYPYLRVVRPGRAADAVPLHRDTYYGASPYELSVVIPFTDMGSDCALRGIAGSHLEPDTAYPFIQTQSAEVSIGSPRHKLGYAYAPRLLDPSLDAIAEPMPVRVGQALIFGLSLVHGGGANASPGTRFSTDVRVVNSLAPVNFSRGVHADYYVPLSASSISVSAQRFLERQPAMSPGRDLIS